MNTLMNNTEFVKRVIKLSKDYDRSRGVFYQAIPTSDYLSTEYKNLVDTFLNSNPVFHFWSLVKILKDHDPTNAPSNQVIVAYLTKKGLSKKKVSIPSSGNVTLWSC
jgi:hypothetical protein